MEGVWISYSVSIDGINGIIPFRKKKHAKRHVKQRGYGEDVVFVPFGVDPWDIV